MPRRTRILAKKEESGCQCPEKGASPGKRSA